MKIGVIGNGYVGSAVAASYSKQYVYINDPLLGNTSTPVEFMKSVCDAIFICVPTPSTVSGECDVSILESVISSLAGYTGIVIAKCTASPDVYVELEKSSSLKLAHVPEFLTAANAHQDYIKPHKIVIGCIEEIRDSVTEVILSSDVKFNRSDVEYCSIAEASYFKYMCNCMLAMKVIINNELHSLAQSLDLNWDNLVSIARTDYRLGATHWNVPGPDGKYGFGGACFPKDTSALLAIASRKEHIMPMLSCATDTNKKYRD